MKIGVIQNLIADDKEKNLAHAEEMIRRAADEGAEIVALPEMFCCPYETGKFKEYAEEAGISKNQQGKRSIWQMLSDTAKECKIVLIGGSFPELDGGKIYNTCFVFDENGRQIARHRKVHLFDVNIKGGQYFKESDTFTAGDDVCVFEAKGHKIGVAICFDIRFVELFRQMALAGAEAVVVPAAFNMTTGPLHWELAFRSRAVDNQYFTIGAAPARDEKGKYVSFAHSIFCDPWGRIIKEADEKEGIFICDIDFAEVARVREQIPIISGLKKDFVV